MIKNINNKRKLLAIDLDGTLLNDDKQISKANLNGLKRAMENNATIAIVTGRALFSALNIIEKYDFDCYLICHNGALIVDQKNHQEIFLQNMEGDAAKKIVDFCIKEKSPIHIFGENFWGVTGINQAVEDFVKAHSVEPNIVKDISEIEKLAIINLVSVGDTDKVEEFITKNQIDVYFTKSVPNTIDIMDKDATKGNGLKILADKLNFKRDEIISIGNYYNDIEMFKASNIGVAIGNSPEEVKKHADYITHNSNNDNGVLEAIEKFIL